MRVRFGPFGRRPGQLPAAPYTPPHSPSGMLVNTRGPDPRKDQQKGRIVVTGTKGYVQATLPRPTNPPPKVHVATQGEPPVIDPAPNAWDRPTRIGEFLPPVAAVARAPVIYEHRVVALGPLSAVAAGLGELSLEGWEVVTVLGPTASDPYTAVCRRPRQP